MICPGMKDSLNCLDFLKNEIYAEFSLHEKKKKCNDMRAGMRMYISARFFLDIPDRKKHYERESEKLPERSGSYRRKDGKHYE